jgi:Trypsin-like peptidase domain
MTRKATPKRDVSDRFRRIKETSHKLVQPHLVAIYGKAEPKFKTEQIGTGFLVKHNGRPMLLTARHVLRGHNSDEEPSEKAIFVAGCLKRIGELRSQNLFFAMEHDIAAVHVDEFGLEKCLPLSCLSAVEPTTRLVTIHGFLAREFKRDTSLGILKPAPHVYTNTRNDIGSGYVGLQYPKSQNRSTDTGKKVMAPRPSGMSGCPMLDGDKLTERKISIIGVFTDYCRERGMAFGESATNALALLDRMSKFTDQRHSR